MLATRWEPFGALWGDRGFRREMNRLFSRTGEEETPEFAVTPPVNVWEEAEKLCVEVELPGLKLEDLKIEITDENLLAITGERKVPEMPKAVWHREERAFGKFARVLELPYPVETEKVEAKLEHGVLFVTLPKAEAAKPRRITVKGG